MNNHGDYNTYAGCGPVEEGEMDEVNGEFMAKAGRYQLEGCPRKRKKKCTICGSSFHKGVRASTPL